VSSLSARPLAAYGGSKSIRDRFFLHSLRNPAHETPWSAEILAPKRFPRGSRLPWSSDCAGKSRNTSVYFLGRPGPANAYVQPIVGPVLADLEAKCCGVKVSSRPPVSFDAVRRPPGLGLQSRRRSLFPGATPFVRIGSGGAVIFARRESRVEMPPSTRSCPTTGAGRPAKICPNPTMLKPQTILRSRSAAASNRFTKGQRACPLRHPPVIEMVEIGAGGRPRSRGSDG